MYAPIMLSIDDVARMSLTQTLQSRRPPQLTRRLGYESNLPPALIIQGLAAIKKVVIHSAPHFAAFSRFTPATNRANVVDKTPLGIMISIN